MAEMTCSWSLIGGQRDKEDSIGEVIDQLSRNSETQAGLSDATRTREGK